MWRRQEDRGARTPWYRSRGYRGGGTIAESRGEDGQQQIAHGPAGIDPWFPQADQLDPRAVQSQCVVYVPRDGASESIERPDEQYIEGASLGLGHHALEDGATFRRARALFVRRRDFEVALVCEPF
jgi:hypothetical protein